MVYIYKLKLSMLGLGLLAMQAVSAQIKIGGTAGTGDASSVLELQSTGNNQGFLLPRITTAQRNAITTPAVGLTIYNTDDQCLNIYKGSTNGWFNMCSGSGGFSFTNCSTPTVVGTINLGSATTATVTLNYVNNTGQAYGAFVSGTTNGITLTAPGGATTAITAGSGSVTLTAVGTPTTSGAINIPIILAGTVCSVPITVAGCSDPSSTVGSTGCVAFTYRGAPVIYTTVRAKDNKIWLQQSFGSSEVATSATDVNAYGDLFQWGRWDDGHQVRTPAAISNTVAAPNNPSGIPATSTNSFYYASPYWWSSGATTDTWSGTTVSATNGKDPCTALGSTWHLPSIAEWGTLNTGELIVNGATAASSSLKLTESGRRDYNAGTISSTANEGFYWSSNPSSTSQSSFFYIYSGGYSNSSNYNRGYGLSIRCLK